MEADESVIVLGEDVGRLGGIFHATQGLWEQFGGARVRNTPISEGGFAGLAVGAALSGLRPVVELQIFDFVTLAADAIVNQAAKLRFMTGGAARVPLVVRGPSGGGIRLAASTRRASRRGSPTSRASSSSRRPRRRTRRACSPPPSATTIR